MIKKIPPLILCVCFSISLQADEFSDFKNTFICDFHAQCVNTNHINLHSKKIIDENLSVLLIESDGYFCAYLVHVDSYHADICRNNLIYHCDFQLASSYFPELDFYKYIDNLDNT